MPLVDSKKDSNPSNNWFKVEDPRMGENSSFIEYNNSNKSGVITSLLLNTSPMKGEMSSCNIKAKNSFYVCLSCKEPQLLKLIEIFNQVFPADLPHPNIQKVMTEKIATFQFWGSAKNEKSIQTIQRLLDCICDDKTWKQDSVPSSIAKVFREAIDQKTNSHRRKIDRTSSFPEESQNALMGNYDNYWAQFFPDKERSF